MLPDGRQQFRKINALRKSLEELAAALIDTAVEVLDRGSEVARRDAVLVVDNAASQYVEEDIRIVVSRDILFGS